MSAHFGDALSGVVDPSGVARKLVLVTFFTDSVKVAMTYWPIAVGGANDTPRFCGVAVPEAGNELPSAVWACTCTVYVVPLVSPVKVVVRVEASGVVYKGWTSVVPL